jgi:hypothetical protein
MASMTWVLPSSVVAASWPGMVKPGVEQGSQMIWLGFTVPHLNRPRCSPQPAADNGFGREKVSAFGNWPQHGVAQCQIQVLPPLCYRKEATRTHSAQSTSGS